MHNQFPMTGILFFPHPPRGTSTDPIARVIENSSRYINVSRIDPRIPACRLVVRVRREIGRTWFSGRMNAIAVARKNFPIFHQISFNGLEFTGVNFGLHSWRVTGGICEDATIISWKNLRKCTANVTSTFTIPFTA